MFRFLALGDSYTIGEGVEQKDSWPFQLKLILDQGHATGTDVQVIAQTGWTAEELLQAIEVEGIEHRFDLVTLQIGVNDQYRAYPLARFHSAYEKLLERAIHFADGQPRKVMAVSIPDWSVTPFAQGRNCVKISGEIDAFNQRAKDSAMSQGLTWINVTEQSRSLKDQVDMLVADALHPSALQYAKWVEIISSEILGRTRPE